MNFPELNLDRLKAFVERWAQNLQRRGGWFGETILYRYAAPAYQEKTSLKWVVAFDLSHCEWQIAEFEKKLLQKWLPRIILDPDFYFAFSTNYIHWISAIFTEPAESTEPNNDIISNHNQRFFEQSGFSEPLPTFTTHELIFPPAFLENDFTDVYNGGTPDNWQHQWLFLPLCKGFGLPRQVKTKESYILYRPIPAANSGDKDVTFSRNKNAEREIWDKWIQPISDTLYNGALEYKFSNDPKQITQADIDAASRMALSKLDRQQGTPFQGSYSLMDVIDRLRAGFKQHERVDLVSFFYDLIIDLIREKRLPAFLVLIRQKKEGKTRESTIKRERTEPEKPDRAFTGKEEEVDQIDSFIKSLTIRYETDSQISIQERGKQKVSVDLSSLGFRGTGGVTWNNFLAVLKKPPTYYWKTPKPADRKQIKTVNDRLMKWMRNNFKIKFPEKYKLYEREKAAGPGVYKFKFNIKYTETDSRAREAFKEDFFSKVNSYQSQQQPWERDRLQEEIKQMGTDGLSMGYLTEAEVKSSLNSDEKARWEHMSKEAYNHE